MSYHASGVPQFRSGSYVTVPPKVRVTRPYGDGISGGAYGATTGKHATTSSAWTPALLRDVESRYGRKRQARETRKATARVTRTTAVREDRNAIERRIAGYVGNID